MDSKRRDIIGIVFFGLVVMSLYVWIPAPNQPPLLSCILLSVGGGLLAWAWLLFNMRQPRYLVRFMLFVQAHETKMGILLLLLVIGLIDTLIYMVGRSPASHFSPVVEWIVLVALTAGGLVWSFLLLRYPQLATAKVPDFAFNAVLAFFVVAAAWFSFSILAIPLVLTVLGVVYLILIRFFPWIPQFRQERQPKKERQNGESRKV